ncbi:MAG TPA: aldo/keto reductase [Polyangiaceae bacterium]|jgi:predicted aldo/keto reductase-like oxidoreductase|nr:aldo/keto reductase [Polyangiaceae bacterium]
MSTNHTRRVFLSSVTLALPIIGCEKKEAAKMTPSAASAQAMQPAVSAESSAAAVPQLPPNHGPLPTRTLGKTGISVSMLGLGGAHIGKPEEGEAIRIMHRAIEAGLTFFDNSWDYNDGESERRMGKALEDGRRDKVFLMTKVDGRTRDAAAGQLEQSLKRLKTDHVDLIQVHEVIRHEDPTNVFAKGGAIEALVEAKKAGKVRFIGFTGHKSPTIHLAMLAEADKHGFAFDTVQMPLNPMDPHYESFEEHVLPVLVKKQIGVLGMKSMGSGILLQSKVVTPLECLRYALSLPTSVVITGIDHEKILDQAIEIGTSFTPMTADEKRDLLARTAPVAKDGAFEKFKTSDFFDSTAKKPEWLTAKSM